MSKPREFVASEEEAVANLMARPWNPTNPEWWRLNFEARPEGSRYQWLAEEWMAARRWTPDSDAGWTLEREER